MQKVTAELDRLEPWLEDGNIILAVQEKYFRVHRSVLCIYSEVFRDMFSVSPSFDAEEETVDCCPVIHLQDAAADVEIMLKALYDRSYMFCPKTLMPIAVLSAFLRLGKKYIVQQLFVEAEGRLSSGVPPLARASTVSSAGNVILFPLISGADPFNFMVMNLASEVGLISIVLVTALYCCVTCPSSSIVDGYDYNGTRCVLSASNQRYCFLVQRYLADVERQLFQSLAYPSQECIYGLYTTNPCESGVLSNLRSIQCLRCPFTLWMNIWDNGLCVMCRTELRRKHEEARIRLWQNLPIELGLGRWEDVDEDAAIG